MITKQRKLFSVDDSFDEAIQRAKKIYLEGEVFVYPTDTIYGFGANPFNEEATNKISSIKERELGKMYIMLIGDIDNLLKYVDIKSENHIDFLLSIWPNPVSVVLSLNKKTRDLFGSETAAFRIPNHRFCLKLLSELKMPLVSTSVNKRDHPPINDPKLIDDEFGSDVEAIFYSEKKSFYEASTLIDLSGTDPKLLREGKLKFDELLKKYNNS